jgi:hypothetical protein
MRRSPIAGGGHKRCDPVASAACAVGICVPEFLIREQWRPQLMRTGLTPEEADNAIRGVVADGLAVLGDGPIGDEPLKFWRAVWEHRHGTRAPATRSGSRSADTHDAARESLRDRLTKLAAKEGSDVVPREG